MYETEITKPTNPVADRERAHAPAGTRTLDQQVLDALLRQEELLTSIVAGMRHFAAKLDGSENEAPKRGKR